MKRWIQGQIVDALERLCGLIDDLPAVFHDKEDGWYGYWWHGQMGCLLGIANLAVRLDDQWQTGRWPLRESAADPSSSVPVLPGVQRSEQ